MPESVTTRETAQREAGDLLRRINRAWLEGRPRDLLSLFHPDIVMVIPGFIGRVQGREALVDGFVDFCKNARVHALEEHEHQTDVIGTTAVASCTFSMIYERDGQRYRSTGRDVWVFARVGTDGLPSGAPCSMSQMNRRRRDGVAAHSVCNCTTSA